jgi:hypothetical protein
LPLVGTYEWLLFLHVTGAFAIVAAVVLYGALVVGPPAALGGPFVRLGSVLFMAGAVLTLVFGIWLAIDEYEIWDAWIIAALVLWAVAGAVEQRFRRSLDGTAAAERTTRRAATLPYALLAAVVLAFLVLMITKPGA